MALAIFGITNSGLNLAASLVLLMLIVLWLALIVYTFLDARRRIGDPFLVACATVASFFPFIGTAVYAIVRPPEFLEDAHERELEIRAAELRVRQLREGTCPNCEYPVEKEFLRCPNCERRLKDPCPTCGNPVDPRWALCPYCESNLRGGRASRDRRPEGERERRPERKRRSGRTERSEPGERLDRDEGSDRGERAEPMERSERPERSPRAARSERDERPEPRDQSTQEAKRPRRRKKAVAGASRKASAGAKRESARGAEEPPTDTQEQRSPTREPDPDPRQA